MRRTSSERIILVKEHCFEKVFLHKGTITMMAFLLRMQFRYDDIFITRAFLQ